MNYGLTHHGILGMKWGVRRYQNKDGLLTSAGKKRAGDQTSGKESGRTKRLKAAVDSYKQDIEDFKTGYTDSKGRELISEAAARKTRNVLQKDLGKLEVKLVKSQMADAYMAGKSKAGRILATITNEHRNYADLKYNLDKYFYA